MLCLVALKKAKKILPHTYALHRRLDRAILAAEHWIVRNSREGRTGHEIPYSPYSDKNVVVNNAISFAVGALGFDLAPENLRVYEGLVRNALNSVSVEGSNYFWYYYTDKQRLKTPSGRALKIDWYHVAQQLEMHCLAQRCSPVEDQGDLIKNLESTLITRFFVRRMS